MAPSAEKPAVILLHGFTNTGASWAPVIDRLAESYRAEGPRPPAPALASPAEYAAAHACSGHDVTDLASPTFDDAEPSAPIIFAPDLRGHGHAAHAEPVELAAVLDDLIAAAPPKFLLCGYSQGGRLALHLALAIPRRVTALVLIGASPGIADPTARAERRRIDERLAAELERLTIAELAVRWEQTPVLAGLSPAAAAFAHADRLRNEPAGLARALRGLGTGALPALWDRLGELGMAMTLIAGERDPKFTAIAHQMAELAPHARVVVATGSGHQVHLERPELVASVLRRALAEAVRSP